MLPRSSELTHTPIRLAAGLMLLAVIAGVRDERVARASTAHVVEMSGASSIGVATAAWAPAGAVLPTDGEIVAAASDMPDLVAVTPGTIERAIVHVQTDDSAGSGFLVAGNRVVTNAHVLGGAASATVWFSNGAQRESAVVGVDEHLDIAVLEVPRVPVSAEPLVLADAEQSSEAGAAVWAWGYPFEADVVAAGFSRAPTVSAGIVSARRMRDGVHYVQTDAAVNPGSSGGPLLDHAGRVIGVNTLVLTPGGEDAEGLNFALDVAEHLEALLALLARDAAD